MNDKTCLTVLLRDGEPIQCAFDKWDEFNEYADYLNKLYPEHQFYVENKWV